MIMATKMPPSDLQAHLGYWLRSVSNAVSQSFARKVGAEGVTVAEWVFLRMLYEVEQIAPTALADRMGLTKGAVSKLADRLVEKGLVRRDANTEDKRAQSLALKPEGRSLVPRLAALADQNDAVFFHALDQNERQELQRLLRKIVLKRELRIVPTD
jgi:MarR family transcriptional regulator, lower aerobic nicotinate degradation pathway regulator